jgi:MATE family multidrug resistance protein
MDYRLLKKSHATAIASFDTLADFTALSFPLVLSQMCLCLPDIVCYVMLGSLGDKNAVTAYGLSWTFYNMLCFSCVVSITEVAGANCSKAFGAGNYQKMAAFFYKSLVLASLVTGVFWVFTRFSEPILLFIDIDPMMAARTASLIKFAFWQNFLIGMNILLQTFVVSQNVVSPLYILNLINVVLILYFCKLFVVDMKLQEIGVVWAKLIQEGVMFLFLVILIICKAKKQTIMLPSAKMVRNGLRAFFRKNLLSFFGIYGEFLAFEANTILVARLRKLDDMTAWITFANVFSILFSITLGLGNAFRTRIGQMVGEGEIRLARLKSIAYFVYTIALGSTVGILLFCFAEPIAQLFINNAEIVPKVGACIRLLSYASISLFCMNSLFVLFRVLNLELYLFKSSAVVLPILSVGTCGTLAFVIHCGLSGIISGQVICYNLLTLVFFFKVYVFEKWEDLVKHDSLSETLSID